MSGILGIVNLDGGPVDQRLLRRMTESMAFRGPDAQRTWSGGCVGFGHTLAITTPESAHEGQPFTLDGRLWIVADARIDARRELADALSGAGEAPGASATDAELVLRAYRAWGDACVDHLLGDFAFAIWDDAHRRLFCARDQMGVKSFFFAKAGASVIFSNTLDCLRLHPVVSDRLNDLAVADFLLFELNQDATTTVFADVNRLPPAHTAIWSPHGLATRRYWTLPVDEPVFYRRSADYIDRFTELLDIAVSDRLRTDRVGVFMSGGLDSSTLAAAAARRMGFHGSPDRVHAFTTTTAGLDRNEGHYARLVADRLGIQLSLDDGAAAFDPEWSTRRFHTAAPIRDVMTLAADRSSYTDVSQHSRVCFYGEGPDNALQYEWQPYLRYLVSQRRYGRLAGDVVRHVRQHRRLPLMSIIPRMRRARRDRDRWEWQYPEWLATGLERRFNLRERWEVHQHLREPETIHPVRPAAHASFSSGLEWESLFRVFDAEETRAPLEVRHPYLDLRLLRFLLSVPPVPWARSKHLIRVAMRGLLPEAVLQRPKSPLTGDPDYRAVQSTGLPSLVPQEALRIYVDPERIPDASASSMIGFRADFRPRALNFWLTNLHDRKHATEENENEIAAAHA